MKTCGKPAASRGDEFAVRRPFLTTRQGVLYAADCLQVLQCLKAEAFDVVFADPPFNLGKDYRNGYDDRMAQQPYLELHALRQALRLGARKGPEKRAVSVSVQVVADQDQALGLAVARMIREGLDRVRPVHGRAPRGGVDRAPRAQRFHEHPDRAGAVPHVCVVVGGGAPRTRRLRRPLVGPQPFGLFVPADHRIARIVEPKVEVQHRLHRSHERYVLQGRIATPHPAPGRQFVFFSVRRTVS